MKITVTSIRMQRGFSMVELMIAMVVSLILLAGSIAVYSSSRRIYANVEQISRVQENGRFALDLMVRDIRSAGYVGCVKKPGNWANNLNNANTMPFNFANPLEGNNWTSGTTWAPGLDASLAGSTPPTALAANNDVLIVRGPKPGAVVTRLGADMGAGTATINAPSGNFTAGDIVMISNCYSQTFFEVISYSNPTITHTAVASPAPGNSSNDVSYPYVQDNEIVPVVTNAYYIAPSSSGSGNALWRKQSAGTPEEIVEGVDGMQLKFGIDSDLNQEVDSYADASATTDWAKVMAVRIAILVRSIDEYAGDTDKGSYNLLGTTLGPYNDRRVRQVFTTTVTLRNRAF